MTNWHAEADVVVIGSGATGIPAAIAAREAGASVILVEAEPRLGGHAIVSGGNVPLGGGTSAQQKHGIEDSPDRLFADLTDWSVVQSNGSPDYRFNDREIVRAFADNNVSAFDWLVAHGVTFVDKAPDGFGGVSVGNSAPRMMHCAPLDWPMAHTGKPVDPERRKTASSGCGFMYPLIDAARHAGVDIRLEHRMTGLHREDGMAGRVIGIEVDHRGTRRNIRARKGVIIGTGGSMGNVNFRRMFDPRLTEEYCGLSGMPWSNQDASGEIAGMAVGAALWGLFNQAAEFGFALTKAGNIGCRYGYIYTPWWPESEVFDLAGSKGLFVTDWQDAILVNMLGQRFYDETAGQFTANNYNSVNPYVPGSYLNARNVKYAPNDFINAAMAGIGDGHNGGGPIWAIFDAEAVARENWIPEPPFVDMAERFFFVADSITELAAKIQMTYQRVPMPPEQLAATVARYNSFVDAGEDKDFGKPTPRHKIAKPPFYAAWATPVLHDTRAGLRINARCQVIDRQGAVIPGLYCGGESAGGFSQHGLARCAVQGLIAGRNAAEATSTTPKGVLHVSETNVAEREKSRRIRHCNAGNVV
jgi:succinate dehydrogenase/fumarate reductase flavoprotein subunit